ncbi:MAG: asparaginase [Polyangiaceae bacterium]
MKRVLFLYTGGTIAMDMASATTAEGRVTSTLAPTPKDLCLAIPELRELADISARTLFNHDSADLGPSDWVELAREIHAALERDDVDGVVVAHGTDTMAYGASFVSFLLGPLPKPVVFTGAQRPLSAVRSDARSNVVNATIAATLDLPEVCIAFSDKVLRGVCATKMDAWGFEAFASPSQEPLVTLGLDVALESHVRTAAPLGPFDARVEPRVSLVRVFPGLEPDFALAGLRQGACGLVLATYGTGTLPGGRGSLVPVLEEAQAKRIPVLVVSQCPRGYVELERYEAGLRAKKLGAIDGGALTQEAALAKMMIGLGRFRRPEDVVRYLEEDTLGERTYLRAVRK